MINEIISERPLISVIVPVYHSEKTLNRCVDSILKQTCDSIEVILVNDGSTAADCAICHGYSENDSRVRVINRSHSGLSCARNSGIAEAKGKYISFVDADDEIRSDMLETLYGLLSDEYLIAVCGVNVVGLGGLHDGVCDGFLDSAQLLRRMSEPGGWGYIIACNKLYDRALFENERFPEGKTHEDEFLIPRLLVRAGGAISTTYCGYIYHLHSGSTSQTLSRGRMDYIEALYSQLTLVLSENLDDLCEGIIKRELYAYLELHSSELMSLDGAGERLGKLNKCFNNLAKKCKISLGLRLKTAAGNRFPLMYHRIDSFFLKLTNR